mmetsp:Transcript_12774/g.30357  ORF Transcript_12774/g.30357 Transcript_12774/m.30357 type:complete len:212 (-) Transcript_12774:373-1008(-)
MPMTSAPTLPGRSPEPLTHGCRSTHELRTSGRSRGNSAKSSFARDCDSACPSLRSSPSTKTEPSRCRRLHRCSPYRRSRRRTGLAAKAVATWHFHPGAKATRAPAPQRSTPTRAASRAVPQHRSVGGRRCALTLSAPGGGDLRGPWPSAKATQALAMSAGWPEWEPQISRLRARAASPLWGSWGIRPLGLVPRRQQAVEAVVEGRLGEDAT